MKRLFVFILSLLLFLFISCNNELYTNRTVDTMNETALSDSYKVEFKNLIGRTVIDYKKDDNDGSFRIDALLDNGAINISYIDNFKNKIELLKLNQNEKINDNYGYIIANSSGKIIIEANINSSGYIYIYWN